MLDFVRGLVDEFPDLRFDFEAGPSHVDFCGAFPVQNGLTFEIGIAFDDDLLSLRAGALRLEYFPVTDTHTVESFTAALRGLLVGSYRVVEYSLGGRSPHKAVLQRRDGGDWRPCGTWSRAHLPALGRAQTRILLRSSEPGAHANDGRHSLR